MIKVITGIESEKLQDPKTCFEYIKGALKDDGKYYLLLDKVQFIPRFEEVLNRLLHMNNIDVYVTESNYKLLSNTWDNRADIIKITKNTRRLRWFS